MHSGVFQAFIPVNDDGFPFTADEKHNMQK